MGIFEKLGGSKGGDSLESGIIGLSKSDFEMKVNFIFIQAFELLRETYATAFTPRLEEYRQSPEVTQNLQALTNFLIVYSQGKNDSRTREFEERCTYMLNTMYQQITLLE